MTLNSCRHFRGLRGGTIGCDRGRDPRSLVAKICGNHHWLFYKIPCTRQSEQHAPVFDCPDLDRKTQADVDADSKAMSEHMDVILKKMTEVQTMKRKMVANHIQSAVATCPWCGVKNALKITVAIRVNNHVHCFCGECKNGFME